MQDFAEERTGGYRFDAHGVLTVDPGQNDYVWFWFDSYGFPPLAPSRGSWEGNSLLLEKQTPRGVGRSVFALELELFRYSVSSRPVGATEFMPVMEGTFIRAS